MELLDKIKQVIGSTHQEIVDLETKEKQYLTEIQDLKTKNADLTAKEKLSSTEIQSLKTKNADLETQLDSISDYIDSYEPNLKSSTKGKKVKLPPKPGPTVRKKKNV